MAVDTEKTIRNQVLYSIYVRNYSEAGTFTAVQADLDRIKALGTDIIWLLPIHPTGEKHRKGTLGSPYAIRDYRAVNPEFGTLDDFRHLVDAIHDRGMKCIIDVVYNHTSPDSWLAEHHPEWFFHKPDGTLGNRFGDWWDVADLDYSHKELWDYQIETLKYWARLVDGFRCDVAPLVPLEFWKRAREEVAAVRPGCFWLCESVERGFHVAARVQGFASLSDAELYQAFDAGYDYDVYPYFRDYLEGKISLTQYADRLDAQEWIYPDNYVKLRFLENHDRARAAHILPEEKIRRNWTAFLFFQRGLTMIYNGQEAVTSPRSSRIWQNSSATRSLRKAAIRSRRCRMTCCLLYTKRTAAAWLACSACAAKARSSASLRRTACIRTASMAALLRFTRSSLPSMASPSCWRSENFSDSGNNRRAAPSNLYQ